jgi:hypothetical protein
MMMFESIVENVLMYGAEIWGWKKPEGARKIFEIAAKSEQRNARLCSERRLQEEQAESESEKECGKV